jgi:hypothetical protein
MLKLYNSCIKFVNVLYLVRLCVDIPFTLLCNLAITCLVILVCVHFFYLLKGLLMQHDVVGSQKQPIQDSQLFPKPRIQPMN